MTPYISIAICTLLNRHIERIYLSIKNGAEKDMPSYSVVHYKKKKRNIFGLGWLMHNDYLCETYIFCHI